MKDTFLALVTSAARAKLLTVLFGRPGERYYQQQLAREAALPLQAVQRELRRLVEARLIRSAEVGGRRLYEANSESAIYPEVFGMVQKLRGAGPVIERALRGDDVSLAWVFGSFATASAQADSDIDLVVIGSVRPRRIRERLETTERSLRRSVNEHVLTTREWQSRVTAKEPFIEGLRTGPKIWLIGDEDRLAALSAGRS